ncbi:CHU large protein endoglucanase-related protein, glucosyl hydrolase family 9 protein [Luminiphilus syltensis NOR5-1B]|uniref:CHU large protein endoglucanase-related protein, glucosyl hydrolase family 9 protein n=1 Tax=Luminiphilus syltensis NOR5-1B TaxID=565045 RepID=B8KSI4_9GAMM|nr:CHU large protein endoglucanase-related protein, glucosyl hydrolase family 9 protein [Luminiphilus syltensis NOR5-1B]
MSAIAQTTGTLTYGPSAGAGGSGATPAEPVPIPSLFLLPLAVALAFFGYRALRKQGGRQLLGAVLLASGVSLGGISSLHIQDAIAQMMIELNQPNGGTVDIPVSDAIYTNTSGVALQIGTVTAPPSCATSAPADECVTDLTLENGESCSTVYDCTQTISFTSTAPTDATAGGATYAVTAAATSGLAVTFSTTSAACSVSDSTVTFEAAGDCVINADQAGDADYDPAPQAMQTVSVGKQAQTISFTSTAPTDATSGGGTYDVAATATSGLDVTFSTTSAACSVSGSTVTFDAVGDCVINADQAGDTDFSAAPQIQQSFSVASPVVTVTKTADGAEGMTPTNASFTVSRTGDTTNPLMVTYTLAGTATGVAVVATPDDLSDDEDYTVASLTQIEIPAASATVDLPIIVLGDDVYDPSETVIVTVSAGAAYTVGTEDSAEAAITAPDKRLFVTAATFTGDLRPAGDTASTSGIAGADAKCEADANKPNDGSTYKAMLAGGGRSAAPTSTDWVLAADTKYFRPDAAGTFIAGTNGNAVFAFPLSAGITATPDRDVFTALDADWSKSGLDCEGWTTQFLFPVNVGRSSLRNSFAIDSPAPGSSLPFCGAPNSLYCAEQ